MFRKIVTYLTAAAVLLLLSLEPAAASTWSITTPPIDTGHKGQNASMSADAAGKLHIGYMDVSGSTPALKYATNASGSWVTSSLANVLPNASNASTATVITPAGPRIMAYSYNSSTGETKYQAARFLTGGAWQLQDIAGGKNPDGSAQPTLSSIPAGTQTGAVQYQGFSFITYYDGNYLWYANERDMFYVKIPASGYQSDLGVGLDGNVHVVYCDKITNSLMYVINPHPDDPAHPENNMVPSTVVSGNLANPSVAVDSKGTLHVLYSDSNTLKMYYIYKPQGGSWSTPTYFTEIGNVAYGTAAAGGYLSIRADSADNLHLSFYYKATPSCGSMWYKFHAAGDPPATWTSAERVFDANNYPVYTDQYDYGQDSSLVLDNFNNVSIAYYDANGTLKVAKKVSGGSISPTPNPAYYGNVAQGGSLTKSISVTNQGMGTLTIGSAPTLTGTNASEFYVSSNTCTSGLQLAPGASCAVSIQFNPTSTGVKSAVLTIPSDDLAYRATAKTVPLNGVCLATTNYTVTSSQGIGGTVSPLGTTTVAAGGSAYYTITPGPGYIISSVVVDGVSQGTLPSWSFNQVLANHTISASFTPVTPVLTWSIVEPNYKANIGKYASIANDSNGKLYLGYMDNSSSTPALAYITNASGSWSAPESVPIPNVTNAGTATVYTPYGPRVMAYSYNATTGARKYQAARKWTTSDNHWQLQDIAGGTNPDGSAQPAIANTTTSTFTGATQSGGYTFISYTDGNNLWYANERDMYYYKFDPSNPVAGTGNQSDLVLDSAGMIHIVYINASGYLGYGESTTTSATNFYTTTLVSSAVSDPTIAIDGNNMLHISYIQSGRVKYQNKPYNGAWSQVLDIGPCGANGAFTSIKANGLNIVHLAYYAYNSTTGSGSVMYATRTVGGVWSTPTAVADTTANYGQYVAMNVDDHHNVNIAYYDVTRTSLKVATKLIPVINVSTASILYPGTTQGNTSSQVVTITNSGKSPLSIGTLAFTGTNPANFSLSANGCTNANLAAAGSCQVTVNFTPNAVGTFTGTLNIPSNDFYTSNQTIALQGAGGPAFFTVTATASSGGTITPSGAVSVPVNGCQTFTMTSAGGFWGNGDFQVDGTWQNSQSSSYQICNAQSNHTIYAWFDSPFRNASTSTYYGSISDAYLYALTGNTLQLEAVTSLENLIFNDNVVINLFGGLNPSLTAETGQTRASSITISRGGVTIKGMLFR